MDPSPPTWETFLGNLFNMFDTFHTAGFPDEYLLAVARDAVQSPTAAGYVFMLWKREQISKE